MKRFVILAIFILVSAIPLRADLNFRELYEAKLSLKQRIFLQNDLIITGYFDGVVDGKIGSITMEGVKRFQKQNGFRPNGLLTDEQMDLLERQRKTITSVFGLAAFDDDRAGFSYMVPERLVFEIKKRENGTQFFGKDAGYIQSAFTVTEKKYSLKQLFDAKKRKAGKRLIKSEFRKNYFILHEADDEVITYYAGFKKGNEVRGMWVSLDQRLDAHAGSMARYLIRSFRPFVPKSIKIRPDAKEPAPADIKPNIPFSGASYSGNARFLCANLAEV